MSKHRCVVCDHEFEHSRPGLTVVENFTLGQPGPSRYITCEGCGTTLDMGRHEGMYVTRDFAERLAACQNLGDLYDLAKSGHVPQD